MNVLNEEHQEIIRFMLHHQVEFMMIGGYAVIYYGYKRTTGDMDLWLNPTNENKLKLCAALTEAGFEPEDLDQLLRLNFEDAQVFSIGSEPQKIDFLTRINLVEFSEANAHKVIGEIDGLRVPVIRLQDLIKTKINTGRMKDQADIDELQRINRLNS